MKKPTALAAAYDEASSSDDDDHSSDNEDSSSADEDEDEEVVARGTSPSADDSSQSDSDGDDSADSNDSDDDSGMEALVASSHRKVEEEEEEEVVSSSADEEDDEDMADLPLQERLQRSEGRGLETLKGQRERKRTALEVAAERLAKFRQDKKEETSSSDNPEKGDGPTKMKKKKSKHAPTEASSKRSDFYRRGPMRLNESGVGIEIGANRYKPLDPRTNSLSGHLNEDQFEKNYDFLQDMRNKEILQLKKQIAARKEPGKKGKRKRKQLNISGGGLEEDEIRLRQLKQEKADFERRKVERAAKRAVKKKIQTEVEEGKRGAYFLKRKEKKSMEFEAKMDELRKRGGHKAVEKALEKRRKKAKSRDASMFAK